MPTIVDQYQDGDYLVTIYDDGTVERVLNLPQENSERTGLVIAYDKQLYTVGETVTWTITVMRDGAQVDVTKNYWVPVHRQDGLQGKMLKASIVSGSASGSFAMTEAGLYRMNLRFVRPKTDYPLQNSINPEFLVEEV